MSHLDHAIRERAYAIWEIDGGQGCADEHWIRAERELAATPATSAKPKARRATSARKDAAVSTRKVRG